MIALRDAVADYLTIRRALGFKLVEHERLLGNLAAFLELILEQHENDFWPTMSTSAAPPTTGPASPPAPSSSDGSSPAAATSHGYSPPSTG
jgi:hypothetical protein